MHIQHFLKNENACEKKLSDWKRVPYRIINFHLKTVFETSKSLLADAVYKSDHEIKSKSNNSASQIIVCVLYINDDLPVGLWLMCYRREQTELLSQIK